ncbi:hypothetical protein LIS04_88 [Listeria phage LIS04]|nr:hypothetical protein LIS04_88 [Listeria phage LIS04]
MLVITRGGVVMENQQTNTCCDHSADIKLIQLELENLKLRETQSAREQERWQNEQDRRLELLEQNDIDFQRDATASERSRYSLHFGAVISIVTAIISVLLGYLISLSS